MKCGIASRSRKKTVEPVPAEVVLHHQLDRMRLHEPSYDGSAGRKLAL